MARPCRVLTGFRTSLDQIGHKGPRRAVNLIAVVTLMPFPGRWSSARIYCDELPGSSPAREPTLSNVRYGTWTGAQPIAPKVRNGSTPAVQSRSFDWPESGAKPKLNFDLSCFCPRGSSRVVIGYRRNRLPSGAIANPFRAA